MPHLVMAIGGQISVTSVNRRKLYWASNEVIRAIMMEGSPMLLHW